MEEIGYENYFPGSESPGEIYCMREHRLIELAEDNQSGTYSQINELCFMGALSYFEAFCKGQWATVINMFPGLLLDAKFDGRDFGVPPDVALAYGSQIEFSLGGIASEKIDFSTAKSINTAYHNIIKMNPFGSGERKKYEKIMSERNLLVHHGGMATVWYLRQKGASLEELREGINWDSLHITRQHLMESLDLLGNVARKIMTFCAKYSLELLRDPKFDNNVDEKMQAISKFGPNTKYA